MSWSCSACLFDGGSIAEGKDALRALDPQMMIHHEGAPVLLPLQLLQQARDIRFTMISRSKFVLTRRPSRDETNQVISSRNQESENPKIVLPAKTVSQSIYAWMTGEEVV